MTLYDEFINDVLKDKKNKRHNDYVQLAVKRHVNDLSKEWNYEFDHERADRAIKIVKLLRHTAGSFGKKLFDLQPYQAFILACLFGWVEKETGLRRFTKSYIEIARKNGKSEFAAAIEVLMTFFDGEHKPQTYTAATKSDQAEYVYSAAKEMCKMLMLDSPSIFGERCKVMQYEIKDLQSGGYIKKMTADSKTEDGANPHCAVVDEYHAHKDDSLLKVIETGTGARTQPLVFIITTAGFDKQSACYSLRTVLTNILRGKVTNDNFFGIIWTLDDNDDWKDESKWIKANPNLGKAPLLRTIQGGFQAAITEGSSAAVEFKTKNLNMWVDAAKVWIPDEIIVKQIRPIDKTELYNLTCYVGLDLSSKIDLTAVAYFFPEIQYFYIDYYCPKDKVISGRRADGVDYGEWLQNDYIKATPGNTIDYDYIVFDILDAANHYNVVMLGYDPYNADLIIPKFTDYGIECGAIRQGFLTLSPPSKKMEVDFLKGELFHDGNQITRWNFGNVELETDAAGNIKPSKKLSKNKIDGVAAIVTALSGFMHIENNKPEEVTLEKLKEMYG